jgi:phytoene desaturase
MAAAIRLRQAGLEVDVFEQSDVAGGKAADIRLGGYRFDTGPSLLTMPFVFRRLFEEAGERLEDHLDLVPLEPLCTNFFPDGSVLRDSSNHERFAHELARLSSDPAHALFRYLARGRRIYDLSAHLFLFQSLTEALLHGGVRLRDLAALPRLDALRSLHRANAAAFRDPRLVQIFDRYATYNGSDPWRAPATLAIVAAVEYGFGGFSVRGGIRRIPQAFEALARKLGVRFHLGRKVERIRVDDGRARGIRVGDEEIGFDAIVTNADVLGTYRHLLTAPGDPLARRYERLEPSTSGLIFLWGMRGEFPELSVSSIFFPDDYREEFRDLFERSRCPIDPAVFVNVTSKIPGTRDAPPGRENWFVMVNAPADRGQDWTAETARTRDAILARLAKTLGRDVEALIDVEEVITPVDIERRTGSTRGSLYGVASNSRLSAFLRHPNRHPRIRGLYFCGGSAHPGGGMPLVTLSGMIAADLLLKYESDTKASRRREGTSAGRMGRRGKCL